MNWHSTKKTYFSRATIAGASAALAWFTACSLEPKHRDPQLTIDLSNLRTAVERDRLRAAGVDPVTSAMRAPGERAAFTGTFFPPPSTADKFDCYAVNVMGPGIPSRGGEDPAPLLQRVAGGENYCSYIGAHSRIFALSAGETKDLTISLPSGPQRIVQFIGIKASGYGNVSSPSACVAAADGLPGVDFEAYEIGHAVLDVFSDQSVALPAAWPVTGSPAPNYFFRHLACHPRLTINLSCTSGAASGSISWDMGTSSGDSRLQLQGTLKALGGASIPLTIYSPNLITTGVMSSSVGATGLTSGATYVAAIEAKVAEFNDGSGRAFSGTEYVTFNCP